MVYTDSDEEEQPQQELAARAPPPGLRPEELPALFW